MPPKVKLSTDLRLNDCNSDVTISFKMNLNVVWNCVAAWFKFKLTKITFSKLNSISSLLLNDIISRNKIGFVYAYLHFVRVSALLCVCTLGPYWCFFCLCVRTFTCNLSTSKSFKTLWSLFFKSKRNRLHLTCVFVKPVQ